MKKFDVVIIGAGTAGLTARKEVAKQTDNYLVVDNGPLGTTCARVGCMPSKVLIQVANDFDRRNKLAPMGIIGAESMQVDHIQIMNHVRSLRDRFVRSVKNPMAGWEAKLVQKTAKITGPHSLTLDDEEIGADKIIIAAGSRPFIPKPWLSFKSHLLDTNEFFEIERLPDKIAIIGLGVIGCELGQSISRLGVEAVGITVGKAIGGASDPVIQDYIADKLALEMPLHFNGADFKGINSNGLLEVEADGKSYFVEKALISVGRTSNADKVGLDSLGIELDRNSIPKIDHTTMQLIEAPSIFMPGDVNGSRPILHEAADEGTIAGFNAVNSSQCFKRRVPLGITFSDPNIASVGKNFAQLSEEKTNFVTGEVSFEGQGRSIVKNKEGGLLHVYADDNDGKILGCELFAPEGEHLAHLIAWAMSVNLTVFEALKMPFYHPVLEEGLRTALRKAAMKVKNVNENFELFRCADAPIR